MAPDFNWDSASLVPIGIISWGLISVFPMLDLEDYVGVPSIDIWGAISVVVVLGIVGLCAGIFPARRAANLQPVQALKLF